MRINNEAELADAELALAQIKKAILQKATGEQVVAYTIGSRQITKSTMSYNELKALRNEYEAAIIAYKGIPKTKKVVLVPVR